MRSTMLPDDQVLDPSNFNRWRYWLENVIITILSVWLPTSCWYTWPPSHRPSRLPATPRTTRKESEHRDAVQNTTGRGYGKEVRSVNLGFDP